MMAFYYLHVVCDNVEQFWSSNDVKWKNYET